MVTSAAESPSVTGSDSVTPLSSVLPSIAFTSFSIVVIKSKSSLTFGSKSSTNVRLVGASFSRMLCTFAKSLPQSSSSFAPPHSAYIIFESRSSISFMPRTFAVRRLVLILNVASTEIGFLSASTNSVLPSVMSVIAPEIAPEIASPSESAISVSIVSRSLIFPSSSMSSLTSGTRS